MAPVAAVLQRPRFELIPTPSAAEEAHRWLSPGATVTVTSSPTKGIEATLGLAEVLAALGFHVVPHLAARLVVDEVHLKEIVSRLAGMGVSEIFVPAGDADPPAGIFDSSLGLLVALSTLDHPFCEIGITGYPESHPRIDDDVTVQAMWDKRVYATYLVSNLCFDAATVRAWVRRIRKRGVTLPLNVGLTGPVDRTKLISVATKIGVGESAKFLTKHAEWFLRLGIPGGYSPNRFLFNLSGTFADPTSMVRGVHLFTFNQIRQTEQWRLQLLERIGDSMAQADQTGANPA